MARKALYGQAHRGLIGILSVFEEQEDLGEARVVLSSGKEVMHHLIETYATNHIIAGMEMKMQNPERL